MPIAQVSVGGKVTAAKTNEIIGAVNSGLVIPSVAGSGVTVDADTGVVSFAAATAVSLNDCFPPEFTAFDMVLQFNRSTSLSVGLRLRLAGTDNSATKYDLEQHFGNSAASTAGATANATQWANVSGTASTRAAIRATLFSPNTTDYTMGILAGAASGTLVQHFGLLHDVATAFDGLSLIVSTGNITGTIAVRGIA